MADLDWLTRQPIAHRGYHDLNNAIYENTLSAFDRAADAGFAIECDIQYAADGVAMVFHDYTLDRLCGIKGDIRAKMSSELQQLAVGGTDDHIPTVKEMLECVAGRVPLVIEFKGRKGDDDGFAGALLDDIQQYEGDVAVMSFDHDIIRDLKKLNCPRPVGLTAMGQDPELFFIHEDALNLGLDFISYQVKDLPNPFIEKERASGRPVITWTVRDAETRELTRKFADQMTFEGFDPREVED